MATERTANFVPSLQVKSNAANNADVLLWADPSTHRLLVDAVSFSSATVVGTLTNNNAAPAATNVGALTALANAAAPTFTEGNQTLLSVDLAGNLRVTGSLSVGGTTDNSAFTAGTTTGTPAMGFYHSTIDTVTDGRAAAVAITSKRAMMVNLQTAAGVETGIAAVPLQVSLANTGANATKILVTPDSVALPANQSVNISQVNASSAFPLEGNTFADSKIGFMAFARTTGSGAGASVKALMVDSNNNLGIVLPAETTKVIGTVNIASAQTLATVTTVSTVTSLTQFNGQAIALNTGTRSAGTLRVTIATDDVVPASQSGTWTVQPGNTANTTAWLTTSNPTTTGGLTIFHLVSAATTNATNIKASAGQVYGWYIYNSNAAARKVVFHNTAGTPTAGAGVIFALMIPPTSAANVEFSNGIAFATGIAISTVTDLTDAGTTAVALNDLIINIYYK